MKFNPCNPCCGAGECAPCAGYTFPTDLYVTIGNNTWGLSTLFCLFLSGRPFLDCVGSFPVIATSGLCAPGSPANPPPYYDTGTSALLTYDNAVLTSSSHHVVWDASFVVRLPVLNSPYSSGSSVKTGAWYVDTAGCSGYSKFRVIFYCLAEEFAVDLVWFVLNGESVEVVHGWLTINASLGATYNSNTNTCDPVYIQFGDMTNFVDNSALWTGTYPDQTVSGNIIDATTTAAGTTIYAVVTP